MDIVREAYLKTLRKIEPEAESASYFHDLMRKNMVSLVESGRYTRSDWPAELGEYPRALAKTIRQEIKDVRALHHPS